jgi:hypothetical protein
LEDVSVVRGRVTTSSARGGGIWARGDLALVDASVTGNQLTGSASFGGGLASESVLRVQRSVVADNGVLGTSTNGGGGIAAFGPGGSIVETTLSGNSVNGGEGCDQREQKDPEEL